MTRPDHTTVPPADLIAAAELREGWTMMAVSPEFDTLMYWLDRAHSNGDMPHNMIETWEEFDYRRAEGAAPTAAQAAGRSVADAHEALRTVVGCFRAAEVEGLSAALAETADDRLKDLVERRLMYALFAAQDAVNAQNPWAALARKAVDVLRRHAPPDGLSDAGAIAEFYDIFDGPEFRAAQAAGRSVDDSNPYYGQDCPKGMVQVEFVGCSPADKRGEYGWKPCQSTFLDVYVDGQRFYIKVGDFHDGVAERRGLHVIGPMNMLVEKTSCNAATLGLAGTASHAPNATLAASRDAESATSGATSDGSNLAKLAAVDGRNDGLEAAAVRCEAIGKDWFDAGDYLKAYGAEYLAADIRELKTE